MASESVFILANTIIIETFPLSEKNQTIDIISFKVDAALFSHKPSSMNFTLLQASKEHKIVIRNLMQFYMYDFSEYTRYDVEDNGLFAPYADLQDYFEGDNKFPYIITADDKYVGFVLVKFTSSKHRSYFSIAEFFILKKYRHEGIGKAIAIEVFNLHKGQWEVHQRDNNKQLKYFGTRLFQSIQGDTLQSI